MTGSSLSGDNLLHCSKVLNCQTKRIISLCLARVFACSKFKNVRHSRREMRGSSLSRDNLLHCSKVLNCQTKRIISL